MESYEELFKEVQSMIEGTYDFKDEELDKEYLEKERRKAELFSLKTQQLVALASYLSSKESIIKLKSAKEKLDESSL